MIYYSCFVNSLPNGTWPQEGKEFIYVLRHPLTKEIRYVGKAKSPRERYHVHMKPSSRSENFASSRWIQKMYSKNLYPIMDVFECVDSSLVEEREIYWIAQYRALLGRRLLNITKGGEGRSAPVSEEAKRKTSLALVDHPVSIETRQMLREAQTGRVYGPETLRKVGDASKRVWGRLTPEQRQDRVKGLGADYERTPEIRVKASKAKLMKRSKVGVSKYLGVTLNAKSGAWIAQINDGAGQRLYLGSYRTEAGAASAFNRKAKELYGDRATLNEVEGGAVDEPGLGKRTGSKYRGVGWNAQRKRWVVRLKNDGKVFRVGSYTDEQIAAIAYDTKVRELGLDRGLNFP